jgi:Family of unknown function (DUF6364)
MKSRYTFTLDPEVSHRAKSVAHARGQSLSGMVEDLLTQEIGREPGFKVTALQPFSKRWKGRMKMTEKTDLRVERLKIKHGL